MIHVAWLLPLGIITFALFWFCLDKFGSYKCPLPPWVTLPILIVLMYSSTVSIFFSVWIAITSALGLEPFVQGERTWHSWLAIFMVGAWITWDVWEKRKKNKKTKGEIQNEKI